MKKILNILFPCLTAIVLLSSCNDTMDDKSVYDARYSSPVNPTVTLVKVVADSFSSITATCTLDTCAVIEEGIQFSTDATFGSYTSVPNDTIEHAFIVTATENIEGETTYYVRAYVVKKDYTVVTSEVQKVTTPRTPIYTIDGVYTATEYELNEEGTAWGYSGTYKVSVEFVDETTVGITNIWDGGETVYGVYDAATQQVSVPTNQLIYTHPSYGPVVMKGVNASVSAYTKNITFQFTPLGGTMSSTPWGAVCSLGAFGYCYLDLVHDDVE